MISPRLLRAYRRTLYCIGDVEVCIGRRSPQADALLRRLDVREGALVSAHNPRSRRMPGGWNERMHRNLLQAAARLGPVPARGCWRGWSEEHVFLPGSWKKAQRLGRVFRQNGIVIIRRGQPAHISASSG